MLVWIYCCYPWMTNQLNQPDCCFSNCGRLPGWLYKEKNIFLSTSQTWNPPYPPHKKKRCEAPPVVTTNPEFQGPHCRTAVGGFTQNPSNSADSPERNPTNQLEILVKLFRKKVRKSALVGAFHFSETEPATDQQQRSKCRYTVTSFPSYTVS